MIFKGVGTALVTPFCMDGNVDYLALENLIKKQIENNIDAIIILGTTGESSTITTKERETIITFSKRIINNRCKLIVGTGSNCTDTAIKLTKQAETLGADACLIVSPYYNKCTQQGIIEHYKQINSKTNIPFIVYNVPSRTGVNILPETELELSKLKNMCGIKEANDNINHILELFNKIDVPIYCGNDNLNYLFSCLGGAGTISVASNAYPNLIKKQFDVNSNSLQLHLLLHNFFELLFIEPNPIPIKFVLSYKGLIKNKLRLPLTPLSENRINELVQEIEKLENLWTF